MPSNKFSAAMGDRYRSTDRRARYDTIATKGNAARLRRGAHRHRIVRTDVRDERSGNVSCDRHKPESGLTRIDGVVWHVGNPVAHRRPVVRVELIEHLDIIQHLDPIDSGRVLGSPGTRRSTVSREAGQQLCAIFAYISRDLAGAHGMSDQRHVREIQCAQHDIEA
jgi:hypothetical protein